MPVRMEKDDPRDSRNQGKNSRQSSQGRGGGFSLILRFLPFILMFLWKRPKLVIPVLLIGVVVYFLGGFDLIANLTGGGGQSQFSFGATLSEEKYDQAQVFEPLAMSYGYGSAIPEKVSLAKYAPTPRSQGRQGSCVGWASAYAARTILESAATGSNPNAVAFSPSYLYNQIKIPGSNCQGAYMLNAMKTMQTMGAVPFSTFEYDEGSCAKTPGTPEIRLGQQYRIENFTRLTKGANRYEPDIDAIKQHIAQGSPIVIGMQVGGTFMQAMRGKRLWTPTQRDRSLVGFSGHAMCAVAYDDNYEGGAFQIMNSWGTQWGDDGFAWVRYPDFEYFVKEAYGIAPLKAYAPETKTKLAVEFGLLNLQTEDIIPLDNKGNGIFRTKTPLNKGDKFKVLVANSIACNVYVFGMEADGSSYVLFPYTSKHSSFFGITGTRLFPKDYSMTLDEIGNKDYIAIVVTKTDIDFVGLNNKINRSQLPTYAQRLREALDDQLVTDVTFKSDKTQQFVADIQDKNAVAMVVEIDKK